MEGSRPYAEVARPPSPHGVAVFLVVLLVPAPWFLLQDSGFIDADPEAGPTTLSETPPDEPKPELAARIGR